MKNKGLWQIAVILGVLVVILTGCSPAIPTTASTPTATAPTDALIRFRGDFFSTSGECAYCHTGMSDATGTDISIDSAWRSSMMANSTRDPYYRASVRSETLAYPEHQTAIEKKCSICHIGMAYHTAENSGQSIQMLPGQGFLDPSNALYPLAADGVSCSLCHQIQAGGFGSVESYSGGYEVDSQTPAGERFVFGHFAVADAMAAVMKSASGFQPQQTDFVKQSEICAVCHNLFTPYITNAGELSTELFPEQTPHLEWQHSVYQTGASCQVCHMPAAVGDVALANTGSPLRTPFMQHTFAGGNAYMLNILSANAEALEVTATQEQLTDTRTAILDLLQQRSAALTVTTKTEAETLVVVVKVAVQTGHKLPTSFPSRRAWLHVTVKDSAGAVLFESGAWQADGMILENDNDRDASLFEPHYSEINQPDQVQIYETIIGDPDGKVTTALLRAKSYLKDNRLLPTGFDKATASAYIGVYGEAVDDEDFIGGGDLVIYRVPAASGEYTIEVELLYQSIGYRWAEKFRDEDNPEGAEFYGYADNLQNIPVVIASQFVKGK